MNEEIKTIIKKSNVFVYRRKSTEGEDKQIASLYDQMVEVEKLANYYEVPILDKFNFEEAKSAKKIGRPVFNEMVEQISRKGNVCLFVWKPNRISRNPTDSGKILQLLDDGFIKAIITPNRVYISNGEDTASLYNEFGASDKYSKDLSADVKRGMNSKVDRGWWPNGMPKPGYLNYVVPYKSPREIIQIVDEDRFPKLQSAMKRYLTGNYSIRQILEYLNEELGYRTQKYAKIGGNKLLLNGLYRIMKDPICYGVIDWKGHKGTLNESLPRLLTEEEYWLIQKMLGRKGVPRPRTYFDLEYRGIFTCGTCGGSVIPYVKNKKIKNGEIKQYKYIKCTRNRSATDCHEPQITVEDFEEQITNILDSIEISEEFYDWSIKWLKHDHEIECKQEESILSEKTTLLKQTRDKALNLVDLLADGRITLDQFSPLSDKYKAEIEKLEIDIKSSNQRTIDWITLAKETFEFALRAKQKFAEGTAEEKMDIIKFLGSNFILTDKKLFIDLKKPFFIFKNNKEAIFDINNRVELVSVGVPKGNEGSSDPKFSTWWAREDSNLHPFGHGPKPCAYANSATRP